MKEFKHELGKEGEDIITKTKGIIVARAEHLTGCNTYGIAPQALKDGKRLDTEWFDEGRIKVIGEGITAETAAAADNGSDSNEDNPR